jgi:hypothetical protein
LKNNQNRKKKILSKQVSSNFHACPKCFKTLPGFEFGRL